MYTEYLSNTPRRAEQVCVRAICTKIEKNILHFSICLCVCGGHFTRKKSSNYVRFLYPCNECIFFRLFLYIGIFSFGIHNMDATFSLYEMGNKFHPLKSNRLFCTNARKLSKSMWKIGLPSNNSSTYFIDLYHTCSKFIFKRSTPRLSMVHYISFGPPSKWTFLPSDHKHTYYVIYTYEWIESFMWKWEKNKKNRSLRFEIKKVLSVDLSGKKRRMVFQLRIHSSIPTIFTHCG